MATQGWWDANYRNGFWSVEAQEEKVAALRRQVFVMWGMVDWVCCVFSYCGV